MGRTHGVHAEPTTFGLKLAAGRSRSTGTACGSSTRSTACGWASSRGRSASRGDRPEVERITCERLGLEPAPSSTQILQRDRHAELPVGARARGIVARAIRARDPSSRANGGAPSRGAVRSRGRGLVGNAAQAKPDRLRAGPGARAARPSAARRPESARTLALGDDRVSLVRHCRRALLCARDRTAPRPRAPPFARDDGSRARIARATIPASASAEQAARRVGRAAGSGSSSAPASLPDARSRPRSAQIRAGGASWPTAPHSLPTRRPSSACSIRRRSRSTQTPRRRAWTRTSSAPHAHHACGPCRAFPDRPLAGRRRREKPHSMPSTQVRPLPELRGRGRCRGRPRR